MQYRKYGKTGWEVSAFGMGCMRLPTILDGPDKASVDREKAGEIIRRAADGGVNYFDTAFGYHHETSEEVLGEALSGGLREKVKIATKQPLGVMKTQADIRRNLENSLKKLRTDYIDVYLIHNINPGKSWEEVQSRKIIAEWERFKSEGLIKAIGFSYHGNEAAFPQILDAFDWDMCQIQMNLLDVNNQATEKAIGLAGKKGCALVIMEPLRGGGLATPTPAIQEIYDAHPVKRSACDWAFRFLLDRPEVSCILSGVSTLEQCEDNLRIFSAQDALPGCLTERDKAMIAKVRERYQNFRTIPCTGCEYCLPCPAGVNIPNAFSLYNDGKSFGNFNQPRRSYSFAVSGKSDASRCKACGECEKKCPQHISIISRLKEVHETLKGWIE